MTAILVHRPPRRPPPPLPTGEVLIEAPPELQRHTPGQGWPNMLPMLGSLGSMGFLFSGGMGSGPMTYVVGGLFLLSSLGFVVMGAGRNGGQKKLEAANARRDYLRYLVQERRTVRRSAEQQRASLTWRHPDPHQLISLVTEGSRIWERRPHDPDFGHVRLGVSRQRLATEIVPPQTVPLDELEPVTAAALQRFIRVHSAVADLPLALSLRSFSQIEVNGPADDARGLVRGMLAELAAFHAPDDMVLAVCAAAGNAPIWDWVKWLPHTQNDRRVDEAGSIRLIAEDVGSLEDQLPIVVADRPRFARDTAPLADEPHLVVVVDGGRIGSESLLMSEDGQLGVTVITIAPTPSDTLPATAARVVTAPRGLLVRPTAEISYRGVPDALSFVEAEALARRLAPLRVSGLGEDAADEPLAANTGLTDLIGVGDPADLQVATAWRPRPPRDRLRVPIGVDENGQPVVLDLKESAQDGMGPHGLVIGATGSGKSELLRTLVIGLVATHSSETLNLVLVDFKGGATFAGMTGLPHVAAVITNLQDDLTMVDRMHDAIMGEMLRRQEALKRSGNFASVRDYEKARTAGADLPPIPSLLIVADEFSELLANKPDFIDLFVTIGRLGRSLSMHLLLSSQRLEEGRLRGLDSHLSYRIGLRTFSAAESRAVLGVPDAYTLPPIPGSGYLKFGESTLTRFKAAYVSGPYAGAARDDRTVRTGADRPRLSIFNAAPVGPVRTPDAVDSAPAPASSAETVMDTIVGRLEHAGRPAHRVWLPPLAESPTLDGLLPPLATTPDRGLCPAEWGGNGRVGALVGIVDKPLRQRRDPLYLDLSGSAGHLALVGGPQAGKSTALRSLITSFALTHTPAEAQFYGLDFGGGTLRSIAGLPHVGAVAGRLEPDLVRRLMSEVTGLVNTREELFRRHAIDSMSTFRTRKSRGELAEDPYGDVFVVIDGWAAFRTEFEDYDAAVADIGARGLGFGVHLILTANRWAEIRPALKDLMGARLELRLGDPLDSEIDRKAAANVPASTPGRGITPDKLHLLVALPRIDGTPSSDDLVDGVAHTVAAIRGAWTGPRAPKVRMLPDKLDYADIAAAADSDLQTPIGVDEQELAPVVLDFAAEPHLLILGDSESGKTNLLRLICGGLLERRPSAGDAVFLVVDYRRSLLGVVPQDQTLGYAAAANSLVPLVEEVEQALTARLPGPDVTVEQLRNHSWWSGPELFIVVDDYDLVSTQSGNPLTPLLELLPQARDIGLHLVIARRMGGASRALYEPLIQRLRELGAPGIMLSGDKEEGVLLGNLKPQLLPPGRGQLVSRRLGTTLVQAAWRADVA